MADLRPINQPEGPLGVFSGESSSNQALNEPKPPDIDRNPHDHVAPPDSMDLDGESTDADENGDLEPSFETALSTTSEEPAQLRDNPMDGSVSQNQTQLSSTMDSFETSVSKNFHDHVIGQVHDQEMAANDENEMVSTSLESTSRSTDLPEQEDSLLIHHQHENAKTQKNKENLQNSQKNTGNLQNSKKNSKNSKNSKTTQPNVDQIFPILGTASKSAKTGLRTFNIAKQVPIPILNPKNGPSASQLQKVIVDRDSSPILQDAKTRRKQLTELHETTGHLSEEQYRQLANTYYLQKYANSLSDLNWAGQEERLKAWNVPQDFCLTALGEIARNSNEKRYVRLQIDAFYNKNDHLDQRHSMRAEEMAKIIEKHLTETIPNKWPMVSQNNNKTLNELHKSLEFLKSQFDPGSNDEFEATKDIKDKMQQLSREISFSATMRDVKDKFHTIVRDNTHVDFRFGSIVTQDRIPESAQQKSTPMTTWLERFQQLFHSPYVGSEDTFEFQLSLVRPKQLSNMYLVGIKASSDFPDPRDILDIMFHTKDFEIPQYIDTSLPSRKPSRRQDRIPYEILHQFIRKAPILNYTDKKADFTHVSFFLIGSNSDNIPNRKSIFLENVQLDIISSYQFCFRCHNNKHTTKRCPVPKSTTLFQSRPLTQWPTKVPSPNKQNHPITHTTGPRTTNQDGDGFSRPTKRSRQKTTPSPPTIPQQQNSFEVLPIEDLTTQEVTAEETEATRNRPNTVSSTPQAPSRHETPKAINKNNDKAPEISTQDDEMVYYTDDEEPSTINDEDTQLAPSTLIEQQQKNSKVDTTPNTPQYTTDMLPSKHAPKSNSRSQPVTPSRPTSMLPSKHAPITSSKSQPVTPARLGSKVLKPASTGKKPWTPTPTPRTTNGPSGSPARTPTTSIRLPSLLNNSRTNYSELRESQMGSTISFPESMRTSNLNIPDSSLILQTQIEEATQVDSPGQQQAPGHNPLTDDNSDLSMDIEDINVHSDNTNY
ncbi:predicted protein [Scheffersomyces stipitis CBS 6054]|uniref:Uncharacterized protein n=1 Tax=Scheffersomyces stipitis (strain ATCC 58785 / CBS 6054 / NBRC 10063 / NRRL Y-11545) TaxID=322104 RepID=A3LNU2_PICST|nr:predicted protein [Scheffersomyces stipitis CBS 6054]ABN64920.2 predicted protein [Scheffersomyces stipitis CBS 6054]